MIHTVPVAVKKTLLRRRKPLGRVAFGAPNQGEGVSAAALQGKGLNKRNVFFSQTLIGWSNHPFYSLHFRISLETK